MGGGNTSAETPTGPGRVAPLDGMRALAVTAVILYHAEPDWVPGGFFGVDVFFVLSGYLITTLLLREWQGSGGIALRAFWARRARRLLPALFCMLLGVGVVAALLPAILGSPNLLGDTVATLGYVANWHLIAAHSDYFSQAANPSPLLPTWSLAIEEQFYLVWPLVILAVLGVARKVGRSAGGRDRAVPAVALVAGIGALASALVMAAVTPLGASVTRSYYGTDTRAQGLLVGACLAAMCLWWGPIRTPTGRRALGAAGILGAVGVVIMWRLTAESALLTFHGGFLLMALGTAALIATVAHLPGHPLGTSLSLRPLPYLGRISYGMYLWYFPVLLVLTPGRAHLSGPALLLARYLAIVGLAAASFHLVESPVRRGALSGWRSWVVVPVGVVAISLLALLVPSLAPDLPSASADSLAALRSPSRAGPGTTAVAPIRVLLVGDSMVGSLGVGLASVAGRYDIQVINRGDPGCSLAEGSAVRVLWYTDPPGTPCQADDPANILATYRSLVRQFDPDVVVYLARSDLLDTELSGSWQHLGQPGFDRWVKDRYRQAIAVLSSRGAHVVLLSSPYYDSGAQGDGQPLPENDPARVGVDARLMEAAARAAGGSATVVNLNSLVSPAGHFTTLVDGIDLRCADGIHFTVPGGQWVGSRILPRLRAAGEAHATAAVAAGRPTLPRQPDPSWYTRLPCGVT